MGGTVHCSINSAALVASTSTTPQTEIEVDVHEEWIHEMNLVRQNPREYAQHVRALIPFFQGNVLHRPGDEVGLVTVEGATAAEECVRFLEAAGSTHTLTWSDSLALAAKSHTCDQGPTGQIGHVGTNGSTLSSRLQGMHCRGRCGENITYGEGGVQEGVLRLLIDDGIPSRGHRKNILNPDFKLAGAFCGPHKVYGQMCTINYAGGVDNEVVD